MNQDRDHTEMWVENTGWRDDIETLSVLLALYEVNPPITGWFSSQRASDAGFGLFHVHPDKQLAILSSSQ